MTRLHLIVVSIEFISGFLIGAGLVALLGWLR